MKTRILIYCLLLCFAIGGCASENTISSTEQMVDEIFTQPLPAESETEPSSLVNEGYMSSISHGPAGVKLTDESGAYRLYEGGEMRLPYVISARGMQDLGVGILLFVDGHPQPYKTTENDTYAYMHTFYPDIKGHAVNELIFTPVVGNVGDTLELYTININAPDYVIDELDFGFAHTSGSIAAGTRLKYQKTPDSTSVPDAHTCVSAFSMEYIELSIDEIAGWTDTQLRKEVEWHFFLNGAEGGSLTGIGSGGILNASFAIWGNSDAAFGLVLYMNNEPISVDGSTMIDIDIRNGKKTVVGLEIPMNYCDSEAVVYAVLVPRNYRTIDAGSSCYIQTTPTFYIS